MAENKNQISTQEWSERMRSGGTQATPPASISRTRVGASGPLAQIRNNLTNLNKQKLALGLGNIRGQYDIAERMANLTQDINANAIARKEQLYANRQANLDRMAQMYGQYYQQFGNVLNKEALDFLDKHSDIKVPTLTAIMAGYEHARASRAEQQLAALDRTAKMADAEAALAEKQVALENERAANDQYANLQKLDAQSKANQAVYDAQKAYLDEQARNEMLGGGLASTGRGTGVRALPGFGGGVGAGARAGVGRVPSAVTGARSGQTVAGGAAPTGRVVQTADGQTVAVDNNKNVIGTVVPTQNGSVVVNDNGQTVGSVDANGNVMPIAAEPQMGAYAQYQAAGGGGFWSNPGQNVLGYATGVAGLAGAGAILGELGESARLGYVNPDVRSAVNDYRAARDIIRNEAVTARRDFNAARNTFRIAAGIDPNFSLFTGPNALDDYGKFLENYKQSHPGGLNYFEEESLRRYNEMQNARRNLQTPAQNLRGARAGYNAYLQNLTGDTLRSAQSAVTTADRAGRTARAVGAVSRLAGRIPGSNLVRSGIRTIVPRVAARAGLAAATPVGTAAAVGLTAVDAAQFGPYLVGGAVGTAIQGARNFRDYWSGDYDKRVAEAIATGQPLPQQRSAFAAGQEMAQDARRGFWNWIIPGRTLENFGMANRDDVNNFSRFFKNITGVEPDYERKRIFDKLPDVSRATILNGMLTNRDLTPQNVQAFIDDTIKTTSTPQEQQAIQQQIQAENDQAVFNRSISSTTGDNKLVEAVTKELGNHLSKLGYNFDYEDLARFGNAYTNMVSWIETRDTPGAGNKTTSATSMYQMTKDFFDNQKKYILNNFHDTLPDEQKDRLIKATSARDLDNDLDRPILQAMVLANVYNNLAVNNQHFDKQGPNIRSDQMAGDVISMMKDAYEAGQFDESGLFLDPVLGGNLARIWAVNFFRGTNPEAVRGAYENVNNAFNEGWGFRRDAQGNNLPWWDGTWNTPQWYRERLGMSGAQTQAQRAGYGFDVAPGVDVDNLNTLLLQRFSAANDAMVSATGVKGRANSGYRSFGKQTELYNNKDSNPNPVGKPGWSFHQSGMALDFNNDEWEKAFNASDQLRHNYGTFDDFLGAFGLQRGVTDRNGKRSDLVHLTMVQDDEYHNTIDHDRLMASRGKWGDQGGNYWMRGVGQGRQTQPAWDVSPQYMVENFGYPTMQYPATDYDPNLIFAGNQNGYVFDYDYDEDGNQIPY